MEKLFGLEMAAIAGVLSAILILVIAGLALLALRRPVFFKLGLRPIPRRRAQSTLIVIGLMVATLIITAAFITGDTLSFTIRSLAIEGMGEMDEVIRVGGGTQSFGESVGDTYFKMAEFEALQAQLAGYPLVDHLVPAISESLPVINITRRRSLGSINVMAMGALLPYTAYTAAGHQFTWGLAPGTDFVFTSRTDPKLELQTRAEALAYIAKLKKATRRQDLYIELANVMAAKYALMSVPTPPSQGAAKQKLVTELTDKATWICGLVLSTNAIVGRFGTDLTEFNGLVMELDEQLLAQNLEPAEHGEMLLSNLREYLG